MSHLSPLTLPIGWGRLQRAFPDRLFKKVWMQGADILRSEAYWDVRRNDEE